MISRKKKWRKASQRSGSTEKKKRTRETEQKGIFNWAFDKPSCLESTTVTKKKT